MGSKMELSIRASREIDLSRVSWSRYQPEDAELSPLDHRPHRFGAGLVGKVFSGSCALTR